MVNSYLHRLTTGIVSASQRARWWCLFNAAHVRWYEVERDDQIWVWGSLQAHEPWIMRSVSLNSPNHDLGVGMIQNLVIPIQRHSKPGAFWKPGGISGSPSQCFSRAGSCSTNIDLRSAENSGPENHPSRISQFFFHPFHPFPLLWKHSENCKFWNVATLGEVSSCRHSLALEGVDSWLCHPKDWPNSARIWDHP